MQGAEGCARHCGSSQSFLRRPACSCMLFQRIAQLSKAARLSFSLAVGGAAAASGTAQALQASAGHRWLFRHPDSGFLAPLQAEHNTLNDHTPKPPPGPPQRLTTEQRVMGTTNEDTWT